MAKTKRKLKKGGIPNKGSIYNAVAKKRKEILEALFSMLDSPNENVRLGAARTLLSKILPDLRSQELTGKYGQQLFPITILTGVDLARKGFVPSSARSSTNGQSQIQGVGLASKSKENVDSNKRNRKTSAP